MSVEDHRRLTVSFTKHQMQLLDRLLEQQKQWRSKNELILRAVREFADQHEGNRRDQSDD